MVTRLIAVGAFAVAAVLILSTSDPITAADKAAKKAAKKKAEPLDTKALYKKLNVKGDGKLDLDEFKKLYTVQPMPKGKKGAPAGPTDLETVFKSLDANGDKVLSDEEFKGVVGAVYPPPKK